MTDKSYSDDEVAEIFRRAAEVEEGTERSLPASGQGMSLEEIREIGREVGLSTDRINAAAAELDAGGLALHRPQTLLGFPIGVSREVALPRNMTDSEWSIFLTEVRDTFSAFGKLKSEGGGRLWYNGNLNVAIEPTAEGHRLRMTTRKSSVTTMAAAGTVFTVLAVALLIGGGPGQAVAGLIYLLVAAVLVGTQFYGLGSWSEERGEQMDRLAARATALLAEPPPPTDHPE